MFERFDPGQEEYEKEPIEAASLASKTPWYEAKIHEEDEVVEELPIMLRGLARIVKMAGESVKKWVDHERWEVGYQSIKDLLERGEEGIVLAFAAKWVSPDY